MFTDDEWRQQEQRFKAMPFTKQESRHFNRMFFAGAADVNPDKQGRFILPDYLKEYAQIKRETIVIGISNRIEIWDRKNWYDFYATAGSSYEQIAENVISV